MKRCIAILLGVYLAFLLEFILYNAFGSWGKPEIMLLTVIFCNLYWGIRYSIWAALVAGTLKDSVGIEPFGLYILIFISACYLTTLIRQNLYQKGSRFSRAVVSFFVLTAFFILETITHAKLFQLRLDEAFFYVYLPQIAMTMGLATFLFQFLRDCVLRFRL